MERQLTASQDPRRKAPELVSNTSHLDIRLVCLDLHGSTKYEDFEDRSKVWGWDKISVCQEDNLDSDRDGLKYFTTWWLCDFLELPFLPSHMKNGGGFTELL